MAASVGSVPPPAFPGTQAVPQSKPRGGDNDGDSDGSSGAAAPAPAPTVNAQGQTIGTRINTTA